MLETHLIEPWIIWIYCPSNMAGEGQGQTLYAGADRRLPSTPMWPRLMRAAPSVCHQTGKNFAKVFDQVVLRRCCAPEENSPL